jgi:glycosyltransferase involved in cell wall biosynthesis
MKILMVLESDFPPDLRVENEISALVNAGHEVHIACFSRKKKIRIPENIDFTIHKKYIPSLIHKASVGALKFGLYHKFWKRFLVEIYAKIQFDAVHVHDLPLAKVGYYLKRKFGVSFVLDLHENWPALLEISAHTKTIPGRILCSIKQWKRYEEKYVSLADQVIVVVEEAKRRLINTTNTAPDKLWIVSNTLNRELFDFPIQKRDPDRIIMIYGGGVNYHRGLQFVIKALPELVGTYPNLVFWIAGTGSYIGTLKKLTEELQLEEHVRFWGWMQQKELLEKISLADYALIPHVQSDHTNATIPHKLFQYMYAGIPIIASDCTPIKRIIEETNTGIIYRDKDSRDFAEAFRRIHEKQDIKPGIKERGKEWVEKKYNWMNDSERLVMLYNELAD